MSVIETAIAWASEIAENSTHGYDQLKRWGPDYDCSSLVISAFQQAGCHVREAGAGYTGNMKNAFLRQGFTDVTSKVSLSDGKGLVRGDVLLNYVHHTALYLGNGKMLQASINELGKVTGGASGDQTGKEIWIAPYKDYPWDCVLRYEKEAAGIQQPQIAPAAKHDKRYASGTYRYVANIPLLSLHTGPGDGYSEIVELEEDYRLRWYGYYTVTEGEKWVLVETDSRKTGWVKARWLRV